jgi:MFS family permease
LQILPIWQNYFEHPRGAILGLFGSIYSIGSLAGLPFAPWLADTYGRRASIWAGCSILFIGVAIQAASTSFRMFVAARFFVGFGCTLSQLSSPLLLTEIAHPQHRGKVTAVYNCLWNVGAIVATWLTFGTFRIQNNWSWRIPSILQAFPSLIQFTFLFFVPESPRWLIKKDRGAEALKILAKYHANGDETDETVMFEYAEMLETIRLEYRYKKESSYLDFFKTKGNRYRLFLIATLGLFSQWSGNGLTSYYFRYKPMVRPL